MLIQPALIAGEVVPYLLRQGILTPQAIVDGTLRVVDASRRNRTFLVERDAETGFVVRQLTIDSAAEEARLHGWLAAGGVPVPRLLLDDSPNGTLVFERSAGVTSLHQHERQTGRCGQPAAMALGQALGRLHRLPVDATLPARPPDVLKLHQPTPVTYTTLSRAGLRLAAIVASEPSLAGPLARLAAGWQAEAVIHADIKAGNIVIAPESGQTWLIDWETAGIGDPAWDAGSALAIYLAHLAGPTPAPPGLQAAAGAFWTAWTETVGPATAASPLLTHAISYAAACLIQTAIEEAHVADDLTERSILLLQLAADLLDQPAANAARLLGIDAG